MQDIPKNATKGVIRNSGTIPCANIKTSIARKQLPRGDFLDENQRSLVASILAIYPESYTLLKSSIYYDSFVVFPIRTSFITAYITVDSLIMDYHILGFESFKEEKSAIWDKILNIKYRALKKQKVDKSLFFQEMMLTNGVSVTILKQNFESGRCQKTDAAVTSGESSTNTGRKIKRTKTINEDSFTYVEDLTTEQLKRTKGRCVLIDPEQTITINNSQLFRFTKNQRNKKSRRLRFLTNNLKPESIQVSRTSIS
ncbi:hypothetical protein J3Q64DRAFT_1808069 [Phycomyces blakesleeanus]|uniref:Uncharacterized protein n=1 Tax=Phycomyces blakesleeanus TaxID=4837 RepID=A0ABR3B9T6_PHYBL